MQLLIILHTQQHVTIMQEIKAAKEFFQRKIDYVTENLEKMQQIMMEKHKIKESEA